MHSFMCCLVIKFACACSVPLSELAGLICKSPVQASIARSPGIPFGFAESLEQALPQVLLSDESGAVTLMHSECIPVENIGEVRSADALKNMACNDSALLGCLQVWIFNVRSLRLTIVKWCKLCACFCTESSLLAGCWLARVLLYLCVCVPLRLSVCPCVFLWVCLYACPLCMYTYMYIYMALTFYLTPPFLPSSSPRHTQLKKSRKHEVKAARNRQKAGKKESSQGCGLNTPHIL